MAKRKSRQVSVITTLECELAIDKYLSRRPKYQKCQQMSENVKTRTNLTNTMKSKKNLHLSKLCFPFSLKLSQSCRWVWLSRRNTRDSACILAGLGTRTTRTTADISRLRSSHWYCKRHCIIPWTWNVGIPWHSVRKDSWISWIPWYSMDCGIVGLCLSSKLPGKHCSYLFILYTCFGGWICL